ncbi:FAD-binding dehydrogenase (plasmid) [Paracoccus liaowanqingii]|uniref:FAD-binding dehydrogenase n=1 Tax=Paracoccus liaowanqingii TaxID=2560053 RepID=A0A4Y5STX1_9RHOB|nr:FAD-dependent tricarballylate dehydrogenase TcuA [Paracoccus liaowanqingii]QDA36940.1 FAD-binding dehydrogenase [Paracoccus liaowanqingii]
MDKIWDVIVVGSGNAALCAALAARAEGSSVLVVEKAPRAMAGGNTQYTAGAMRFAYNGIDDLMPLLADLTDPRLEVTDFGSYTTQRFSDDLLGFNDGRPLSPEQQILIDQSLETMQWLGHQGVKFEPIYSRQSFLKDGRHVFWGGLTLAAAEEGVGLFEAELAALEEKGGEIRFEQAVTGLLVKDGCVTGVTVRNSTGEQVLHARAVILACGGFEASEELRAKYIGPDWAKAKVRGTPHNTGDGLRMAFELGAEMYGFYEGCHATPMDLHMKDYGNLDIPHGERKNYRKISYFLGIMINADAVRFVDEGRDFRNYTYAQFGRAVLEQPGHFAWQIFDAKVDDLLYAEYRFHDAHYVQADTLEDLIPKLEGVNPAGARSTIEAYNQAVMDDVAFDPTIKDGKGTRGLELPKSNWAQKLDTGPFKAYPVTGGITFTYGGVKLGQEGQILRPDGSAIDGLFACGEMVGGVFYNGYPGGSGLTSGAVFGRIAGRGAAAQAKGA